MLFSGPLLSLVLHVPASCNSYPAEIEQSVLRDVGVCAIIVADEAVATSTCLPVVTNAVDSSTELRVNGNSWIWLRGDRMTLLDRAAALQEDRDRDVRIRFNILACHR